MSVEIDPAQLRYELHVRGWSTADLARRSGVARSTISRAMHGHGLTGRTALALATALRRSKPDAVLERLARRPARPEWRV